MGTLVLLFLLQVALATHASEIDVTTIYYVGDNYNNTQEKETVEVHLRTNSRGLPIIDKNGMTIIDNSIKGRSFNVCDSKSCSWDGKGWEWTYETEETSYDYGIKEELKSGFFKAQPLNIDIRINFEGHYKYDYTEIYMVILSSQNLLRDLPGFYLIKFQSPKTYSVYINYCHHSNSPTYYITDFDGNSSPFHCTQSSRFDISNDFWHYGQSVNSIVIEVFNGKLRMWVISKTLLHLVFDRELQPRIDGKYFSLCQTTGELLNITLTQRILVQNISNSNLTSPWFTTDAEVVCLAVLIKANRSVNITITAENTEKSFPLGSINKHISKERRENLLFTSPLPTKLRGKRIRLLLVSDDESILIHRISSCNGEDGDVAVLNLKDVNKAGNSEETAFNVLLGDADFKCSNPSNNLTSNGGCIRGEEYICPPGFTGFQCESACGQNRFGSDCSGFCSDSSQECQGLRLCTTATGCQCAPGYSGQSCEDKCGAGYYGNNCNQRCGHCKDQGSCDIYTGYCNICESGYYPPYCKDTYPVMKNAPEVSATSFGQVTVFQDNQFIGRGYPEFCQLQYKESKSNDWIVVKSTSYSNFLISPTFIITDLEYGKSYDTRVVLLTDNLNSYQGDKIPVKTFVSLCSIPEVVDYNISSVSNTSSFTITWEYKNSSEFWCPVEHFEVLRQKGWKWNSENTTQTWYSESNLLSGKLIKLKVRAYTLAGFAPFSKTILVRIKLEAPGPVTNFKSQHKDNQLEFISWNPPKGYESQIINYHLQYQCIKKLACHTQCNPEDSQELEITDTNVTLYSLLPLTQYLVSVSAGKGVKSYLELGTKMSIPTEVVECSEQAPLKTNHSITFSWKPVEVCSAFLEGYVYHLFKEDNKAIKLDEGFTKKLTLTFDHLIPQTEYFVQIFIKTSAGLNPNRYLQINISTSATVPNQVDSLTVYKRGRNLLGLRWGMPKIFKGTLESFNIIYGFSDNKLQSEIVAPTPCTAWPLLYCHTLRSLAPNKNYTVTVAARNTEVSQDGTPTTVSAFTKEGIAGLPELFKVVNTTSSSFAVSWHYPWLANGIIRSFIMSVEETEQYDSDNCCEVYPLVETIVTEEFANYSIEMSGLHPASTYTVSLSAKTVSIGPSITLTIYTRPPPMPVKFLPQVFTASQQNFSWYKPQSVLETNNSELYHSLIKDYLLLVILNSTSPDFASDVQNEQLKDELQNIIKTDFYIAAQYQEDKSVELGTGESSETIWGPINNLKFVAGQTYRLAAVQITEYCSVYNIDVMFSSTFTAL